MELVTLKEYAKERGLHYNTLRVLCHRHGIVPVRTGSFRRRLFRKSDLDALPSQEGYRAKKGGYRAKKAADADALWNALRDEPSRLWSLSELGELSGMGDGVVRARLSKFGILPDDQELIGSRFTNVYRLDEEVLSILCGEFPDEADEMEGLDGIELDRMVGRRIAYKDRHGEERQGILAEVGMFSAVVERDGHEDVVMIADMNARRLE